MVPVVADLRLEPYGSTGAAIAPVSGHLSLVTAVLTTELDARGGVIEAHAGVVAV